jgi:hypothetical protein
MGIQRISFALAVVFICGCSSDHTRAGRGDAGQFILKQAIARGATPAITNGALPISTNWRYFEDKDGVVIRMSRKHCPAVEAFLLEEFGAPRLASTNHEDGSKLWVYRISSKGGGIYYGCDGNSTEVTVIRPMTTEEIGQGILRVFYETGKQ